MRVGIDHNDHDLLSLGIMLISQFFHHLCPIFARAWVGDIDKAFSFQRIEEDKQISYAFSLVR